MNNLYVGSKKNCDHLQKKKTAINLLRNNYIIIANVVFKIFISYHIHNGVRTFAAENV